MSFLFIWKGFSQGTVDYLLLTRGPEYFSENSSSNVTKRSADSLDGPKKKKSRFRVVQKSSFLFALSLVSWFG